MSTFIAKEMLPEGYAEAEKIDLVKNRKQMLLVNGLALLLTVVLVVAGLFLQPDGKLFDLEEKPFRTAFKCLTIAIGIFAYIAGHEAVHGLFMWHFSHIKPTFGFSFTYAYAGSNCYFAKNAYLAIALAPVAIWAVLLGVLNVCVPGDWFWVVWAIQIMNISGAAGDFYVFFRMLRAPETVLVQDTGTAMTVYLPQN